MYICLISVYCMNTCEVKLKCGSIYKVKKLHI